MQCKTLPHKRIGGLNRDHGSAREATYARTHEPQKATLVARAANGKFEPKSLRSWHSSE